MSFNSFLVKAFDALGPVRRIAVCEGDSLPPVLPWRGLILARDDGEDWSVGFHCPCGCRRRIELLLVAEARPRWDLTEDKKGRPTLSPSVWLKDGCRSHFWLRGGRIEWAKG